MNKLLIAVIVIVGGCGREHEQIGNVAIVDKNEVGANKEIIHISSFEELCMIGGHPAFPLNSHYELTADIDASQSQEMNGGQGFRPIGKLFWDGSGVFIPDSIFTGVFDGKGYAITGLFINRPNDTADVGLFGVVNGPDAKIRNLRVVSATVIGKESVGGLVGSTNKRTEITRCSFSGTVTGTDRHVGGLVGFTVGDLMITSSYFTGDVRGGHINVGGLVGTTGNNTTIIQCYSTGNVTGKDDNVGGLVGTMRNNTTITQCYFTGNAIGGEDVGGLVGDARGGGITITQCYYAGGITGKKNVSGLIGSQTKISFWDVTREQPPHFRIKSSYWNVSYSGMDRAKDRRGKTTAQMMRRSTFKGWDFQNVWQIDEGKSYPRLNVLEYK